jgi:hypothetical protein
MRGSKKANIVAMFLIVSPTGDRGEPASLISQ